MGRLKKGGIPDQMVAARIVLNDWNCGKIKYHTYPPEEEKCVSTENEVVMEESQIVSEFAKEFSLDDLNMVKMESEDIANLPNILPSQTMAISTSGILDEQQDCDLNDLSDKEESSDEDVEKENILADKIYIGSNKQSIDKVNKVCMMIARITGKVLKCKSSRFYLIPYSNIFDCRLQMKNLLNSKKKVC